MATNPQSNNYQQGTLGQALQAASCQCGTGQPCATHAWLNQAAQTNAAAVWNFPVHTTTSSSWQITSGTAAVPTTVYYPPPPVFPWHIEAVEIGEDGMVTVFGPGRLVLGTITAVALRRLIDVAVLDAFR